MYHMGKMRAWLKRSAKNKYLFYDAKFELVTDGVGMYRVTKKMRPTLLEIYGDLEGGIIHNGIVTRKSIPDLQELTDLEDADHTIIDSRLQFATDKLYRILYQFGGEKKLLDAQYTDIFTDLDAHTLLYRPRKNCVLVTLGQTVHGALMEMLRGLGRESNANLLLNTFHFVPVIKEEEKCH